MSRRTPTRGLFTPARRGRKPYLAVTTVAAAMLLAACGGGGENGGAEDTASEDVDPIVWRWEHALPLPGSSFDQVLVEDLPAMLEEATDGRLTLEVVYGETNPAETLDAVSQGRVDGGSLVATVYGGDHPAWNLGEVAFFFEDFEDFRSGLEEIGPMIVEDVESTGVLSPAGPMPWTSTYVWTKDQPLETGDDWAGQRIRAAGVESATTIGTLGGAAVTMPFAEVYPSIERGVIDGFMSSLGASVSINPWEVTTNLNLWPMGFSSFHAIVNPDSMDMLDEDLREIVLQTFEEFGQHAWDVIQEDDARQLALQEENGLTLVEPSAEDIEALRSQREELLQGWIERAGAAGEAMVEQLGEGG